MGAGSSSTDIKNLKAKVQALESKLSDYSSIKVKINDASANLAKDIKYESVAKSILDVSDYTKKIADEISKNPGALGEMLTISLVKNEPAIESITKGLQTNDDFARTLSSKLTDDASGFRIKLKGDTGETGSILASTIAVKSALYDRKEGDPNAKAGYTMWCADGGLCKLPKDSTGIDFMRGGTKIYEGNGQFNIESDDNIYFKTDSKLRATVANGGLTVENDFLVKSNSRMNSAWIGGDLDDSWKKGFHIKNSDGNWTHFNSSGKSENYIRGKTYFNTDVQFQGGKVLMPPGASLCNSNGSICVDVADIKNHTHQYWAPGSGGYKTQTWKTGET